MDSENSDSDNKDSDLTYWEKWEKLPENEQKIIVDRMYKAADHYGLESVTKEELEDIIYRLTKQNVVQDLIIYLSGIVPTENWLLNSKIEEAINQIDSYQTIEKQKNFILKIYLKGSMSYSTQATFVDFDRLVEVVGDDLEKREWERLKLSIRDVESND